ncbi:MAG: universal stress protein [Desulfuromonadales bacterium]
MLPHYENILVTTDFSANSVLAFRHAVMLARHNDATIHMLHVVPEIDSSMRSYISAAMGNEKGLDHFEERNDSQARLRLKDELNRFAREELTDHPEDLERFAGSLVVHGDAVSKILETAETVNSDVIVMGNHGKGAIEHAFLGSVAEKVLNRSRRPVFVIPL